MRSGPKHVLPWNTTAGRATREPTTFVRDYARASDLVALGIAADTITKEMLFDVHRFDKIVRKTAKSIGYKLNARDFGTEWHRKRDELRDDIIAYLHGRSARTRTGRHAETAEGIGTAEVP